MEDQKSKVHFFIFVHPPGWRAMFYLRGGNIFASFLALTPLFLDQFRQTKILRTLKIMLFPVICGFLPRSERKWGLSRANTTPRVKRGVNNIKKMDFRAVLRREASHTT